MTNRIVFNTLFVGNEKGFSYFDIYYKWIDIYSRFKTIEKFEQPVNTSRTQKTE